ncbi:response regulator [Blastococcus sp. SYSU DS0510]
MEFLAVVSYTLVAYRKRVRPAPVAGISALALVIGHLDYWPELVVDEVAGDLILIAGISVLPVVLGQAVRNARRTTAELTRRNAELVVLRQQAADHAVEAERFRIARELHDVVAHHISAMTVHARAGHHVAERDPQAALDALGYVAEAGSEAVTAMGSFVGTLRGEVAAGGRDELVPQPTLEDLPDLLESFRRTGLVVHEDLHTTGVSVARALGLNAYRIVEEALTNAIRHGAAERVWVQVWFDGEDLHLQVDDNGRGLDGGCTPTGHGLVGMAERAELHGGAMVFGPSPRGGCRVEATLPTGHADSQGAAKSGSRRRPGRGGDVIRVLLADDQQVVRLGFRMVLDGEDDIEVVGEVGDGTAAIAVAEELRPDVALMDVRRPIMDGIAATSVIAQRCPEVRVVVITTFELDEYVDGAVRAGAAGFLLKNIEPSALIEAVRTVVRGDALVDPAMTRSLIDYAMRQRDEPAGAVDPQLLEQLSSREREALTMLSRGMSNAQVAAALFLGEATVKSHVSNMLVKLHLRSRVQAVVLAYETGFVQPGTVGYADLLKDV